MVDIPDIELFKMKTVLVNLQSICNLTEQNNSLFATALRKNIIGGKILYRTDIDFDIAGHGHPDNRLAEEIAGGIVINDHDAFCFNKRHPGFQNLPVNKPVVHSHK